MNYNPILQQSSYQHNNHYKAIAIIRYLFITILILVALFYISIIKTRSGIMKSNQEEIAERKALSAPSSHSISDDQQTRLKQGSQLTNHFNNATSNYDSSINDTQQNDHNDNHRYLSDLQKARLQQQEQVTQSSIKAKEKQRKKRLEKLERSYFPLSSDYHWEQTMTKNDGTCMGIGLKGIQQGVQTAGHSSQSYAASKLNDDVVVGMEDTKKRCSDEIRDDIARVRMKQQEQVRQSAIKAKEKHRRKEMERLKRSYFPLPSK